MIDVSRRRFIAALAAGTASAALPPPARADCARASSACANRADLRWRPGLDGQRRADLGDGTYLNPILAGDRPDPTLLRDGDDFYMTHSSFDAYPGLLLWHSRDLVNWRPVTAALHTPVGSVWAPELTRHGGRYFLYFHARRPGRRSIYVLHAPSIEGPWSAPIDLDLPDHIDPGHAVAEDGTRYLFLSGGDRVRLTPDGLARAGAVEHVYDPWRYPEDWVVESFSPEGPKIVRRGKWFYMITAVGGTAGPPTGHMVIVARARSLDGPWEHDPGNPIVRTWSVSEKWWSRGHATPFEGPDGRWWMVYHGYENGFWTLGRQTLLEPIEWTPDGWFRPLGGDLSAPITKPVDLGEQPHGLALSDDFSTDRLGLQWAFHDPAPGEAARVRRAGGVLHLKALGTSPADSAPLTCIAGDLAYRIECDVAIDEGAEAGLLLFYNRRLYAGLGLAAGNFVMHRAGLGRKAAKPQGMGRICRLRLTNDRNILTIHTSHDGGATWRKFGVQMEVSGYHHNVAGDFLSLRPALYAAGTGEARFANFTYQAL